MTQPFSIAMTIRADAGQAKGTIEDFRKSLQQTSTEAGKVKSALEAEAEQVGDVPARGDDRGVDGQGQRLAVRPDAGQQGVEGVPAHRSRIARSVRRISLRSVSTPASST